MLAVLTSNNSSQKICFCTDKLSLAAETKLVRIVKRYSKITTKNVENGRICFLPYDVSDYIISHITKY